MWYPGHGPFVFKINIIANTRAAYPCNSTTHTRSVSKRYRHWSICSISLIVLFNLFSDSRGLAVCTICPEGRYCNDSVNPQLCPKGHYCPNGSHDHNWKKCPPGTWNPSVSDILSLYLATIINYTF